MNYSRRQRTRLGERVHVRHDVMSDAALVLGGGGQVNVLQVGRHLCQLGVRDGQAQLLEVRNGGRGISWLGVLLIGV